ncbi:MAG: F0F1 ATP synthase subunit delta [Planctomycetota bacterium]|nr:F0F1 ATP synthase subunit delta [Planctomycetota bacterium]
MSAIKRRGIVNVHVRSAMPLTKEQEQEISSAYAKLSGGKPVLRVTVDRELISGLRVEVDNKVINNSLDARLEMLREGLSKR